MIPKPISSHSPSMRFLAAGHRLAIFGSDYATPDGTCIRDYVHVTDLADAHLRVLAQLDHRSVRYNVGTGRGYSVKEITDAVGRIAGRPVPAMMGPRRMGDAPMLIAGAEALRTDTGWAPRFTDVDAVVATAFRWREAHPGGYGPSGEDLRARLQ